MSGTVSRVLLTELTARLAGAGTASSRVDAELILAHVLGVRRSALPLVDQVSAEDTDVARRLVADRAGGVPLQHLMGTAAFRHLELAVGPGVFIPRPETELILELAADDLRRAALVADLCAGSGAVALSVAQEHPGAEVLAVERSATAARWLERNAADRSAAGDRPVQVVLGDVADPELLARLDGTVDVVLSNPPYVPERLRDLLSRDVGHDPAEAVFSGPDGLALMPALLSTSARLLRPGGRFVVEHDDSHGDAVPQLLAAHGQFDHIVGHLDLTGRPRFASARRRAS